MRRLFFLSLGMFTVGSSSFMIAGLLPQIGQSIGQPVSITSQGITAFSLTYLFSAPFFSLIFANRSAKRMLQLALVIFLLGNFLTLCSGSLVPFLLGRILTGLGAGIFNPLCVSLAMGLAGQTAKGRALSLIWGANSAGVVFGVPLALFLSTKFDWRYSIGSVVLFGLIALIGFSLQRAQSSLPASSSMHERLRLLVDKNILSVIGITCFTSLASLGLYSYVSLVQKGAPHSLAISLFFWGLGGFIGSSVVGSFVDRTRKPRVVMAFVILGLALTLFSIPFTKEMPYAALVSFFLWGAFGWATPTPQQHVLFEFYENQRAILSALNSSAIGLGSSLGTAIGGVLIGSGFKAIELPFLSGTLLVAVLVGQVCLVKKSQPCGALS